MSSKLSLTNAIFININIILGAGIFINTVELAQRTGLLGGLLYLLVGIVMLPLVLSLTNLLQRHPGGSFYTFGAQEISPFAGFLSAWSYFTCKLAASTIMIHASIRLLQQFLPLLNASNIFALDGFVILLFVALNMLHVKTGSQIQTVFLVFKMIPIIFAVAVGLFLFNGSYVAPTHMIWSGIPASIPLLIYGTMGFEAAVSLSKNIEHPHKNAPRAILISYAIVLALAAAYQSAFYGALGPVLAHAQDYRYAFPALLHSLFGTGSILAHKIVGILHLAIASSALGGSYGIIFSNSWNLHILAENKHLFFSRLFTRFNRHAIPYACVIMEGILCLAYLAITQGKQVPLQQLASLGVTFSYSMSVLALLRTRIKKPIRPTTLALPLLGLASCLLLLGGCLHSFAATGMTTLITFIALLASGAGMFFVQKIDSRPAL